MTIKKSNIPQDLAILCLILNIIFPGLGSLIGDKVEIGIAQLTLFFGSFVIGMVLTITIIGAIIGIPLFIFGPISAWIWGIVTGIQLIKESNK